MGNIFYVMGKSSSGKDTIYNMLLNDKELGLKNIVGYTTRPKREGEENGREYIFVDENELDELKKQEKVIESRVYNTIYGKWYYFTVNDEQVNLKQYNYILIGTLESYEKVRDFYGTDESGKRIVVPIYINVEDGERLLRAIEREKGQNTPKYAEMCRRFLADSEDFSEEKIKKAEIGIIYENDILKNCYDKIRKDIKKYI